MDINIMVAAHKKYWMPEDPVYLPIHVGAEGKQPLGYTPDNTGDNISAKNPHFCELTAIYWAWKNLDADYIEILSQYSVVVADKRKYYIESNYSHYIHAHHREGLDMTQQIIHEMYPEYDAAFKKVMNRTWAHMFNMFVMRKDRYDHYCTWMFRILFELEKRLDITGYDVYESRVYGFVSELLLDVWLESKSREFPIKNRTSPSWKSRTG